MFIPNRLAVCSQVKFSFSFILNTSLRKFVSYPIPYYDILFRFSYRTSDADADGAKNVRGSGGDRSVSALPKSGPHRSESNKPGLSGSAARTVFSGLSIDTSGPAKPDSTSFASNGLGLSLDCSPSPITVVDQTAYIPSFDLLTSVLTEAEAGVDQENEGVRHRYLTDSGNSLVVFDKSLGSGKSCSEILLGAYTVNTAEGESTRECALKLIPLYSIDEPDKAN